MVFVSQQHADVYERVPGWVRGATGAGLVIGCSAGGVIGAGSEIENRAAISVTVATLPDVELSPFRVENTAVPAAGSELGAWERLVRVSADAGPHFLLLADPFSFDAEGFLTGLDGAFPSGKKIGGLASGARAPGANALFLGASSYRAGLVGVALHGNVEIDTVVAQGCRPVGDPMFVTKCQRNMLAELDGRKSLDVLRDLFATLSEADKKIFRHSLFLGIVMMDRLQEYRQGDFLIRNLVGVDQESARHRDRCTVAREHGRSVPSPRCEDVGRRSRSAAGALRVMLSTARGRKDRCSFPVSAAACISTARPITTRTCFVSVSATFPLGGFFCNGEIGDVHGRTYLHGYTSSFGIFRGRPRA